jgi:hypothetical protein
VRGSLSIAGVATVSPAGAATRNGSSAMPVSSVTSSLGIILWVDESVDAETWTDQSGNDPNWSDVTLIGATWTDKTANDANWTDQTIIDETWEAA